MFRLAAAGADGGVVDDSRRLDLAGVNRLASRQRRVTRGDERAVFVDRFVSIQPTLDDVSWHLTGQLPAVDGKIIEQALHARSDEIRALPGGETCTRAQRQADSLVAMAHDSLNRNNDTGEASPSGSSVSVFVDLDLANGTGGEHGATVGYGPRVGPAAPEELLCTGTVQIIGLDSSRPAVTSNASRVIPTAVRRFVAHGDGGMRHETRDRRQRGLSDLKSQISCLESQVSDLGSRVSGLESRVSCLGCQVSGLSHIFRRYRPPTS